MSVCCNTSVKDTASSVCPKNKVTVFVNLNENNKQSSNIMDDDEVSSNSGNNYTKSIDTQIGHINIQELVKPCGKCPACNGYLGHGQCTYYDTLF
jgi:hypothetical protein